jgi:N-methylhydantoinase B
VRIEEGDTLIIHTPGGGGYGDPRKRDPERVRRDILNGLVSPEAAMREYGIEVSEERKAA